jgi:predicted  nucleic acid-binding Zn-ribbon protein
MFCPKPVDQTRNTMATVAAETTIADQLTALIRLQHIDSKIDQIKQLRGDLPEEIRDMEDEQEGLSIRVEKLKQEQKDNEEAIKQSEKDIKEAESLIKKYEEQQLQVRNNREYDALTKEIEAQKQRIIDSRTRAEEIEAGKPMHDAAVEEAQQRLKELNEVLKAKQKELQDVLEDTKSEQSEMEKNRKKAASEVDKRYLRAYERLRERLRDGRAVVPLVRGAASGFSVPPQRQLEIRQRNRIVACEHTGRIIVDNDLYKDTIKKLKK